MWSWIIKKQVLVEAINLMQIRVVYNKAVDVATAQLLANYQLNNVVIAGGFDVVPFKNPPITQLDT